MGDFNDVIYLAPKGSTGTSAGFPEQGTPMDLIAFQFVVEAVGATPSVTYKFQGTADGSNWFDLGYITDASDTISQATRTRTTVGADIMWVSNPVGRRYRGYRLVVTANTNVTYHAEMYPIA